MSRDYAGCAARGLTMAETALELGVTKAAVSYAARNHGLVFKHVPGGFPMRPGYAECAAAGMTKAETAAKLGVSKAGVSYAAKRLGLTFRQHVPAPKAVKRAAPVVHGLLTPAELADYQFLCKSHRYTRAEALRAIGRGDLA